MSCKIGVTLLVILVSILSFLAEVGAQSGCPTALTSLTPCLSYGVGRNNSSTPSASCCSELANLAQTAPMCLCQALNIGGAQAVGFVLGRVLPSTLSGACNLQFSPLDQCNGSGSDPNNSQGSASDGSAYSNGSMLKMPLLLAMFITLLAFYAILLD